MENEIKQEFSNGELTIVWKPKTCIHSGECVRALPKVYHPMERPWIKIENATTEELKAQIKKCPSGALSFYMNNSDTKEVENAGTHIVVKENGPLIVHGTLEIKKIDGSVDSRKTKTAFCRCGHSNNKPYCDGSHTEANFKD